MAKCRQVYLARGGRAPRCHDFPTTALVSGAQNGKSEVLSLRYRMFGRARDTWTSTDELQLRKRGTTPPCTLQQLRMWYVAGHAHEYHATRQVGREAPMCRKLGRRVSTCSMCGLWNDVSRATSRPSTNLYHVRPVGHPTRVSHAASRPSNTCITCGQSAIPPSPSAQPPGARSLTLGRPATASTRLCVPAPVPVCVWSRKPLREELGGAIRLACLDAVALAEHAEDVALVLGDDLWTGAAGSLMSACGVVGGKACTVMAALL